MTRIRKSIWTETVHETGGPATKKLLHAESSKLSYSDFAKYCRTLHLTISVFQFSKKIMPSTTI